MTNKEWFKDAKFGMMIHWGLYALPAGEWKGRRMEDIGEWAQPDSTNPYMKGDRVTHNGHTWESDIDNNVWEPSVYGWTQID